MLLGSNFGLGKGYANGMTFLGCDGPVQHPAWGQALAKNLTTEELAHLTQDQAASKQVIEKEIEGYLEAWGVQFKLDISRSLLQEVADLKRDLNLSDERAAKLDALAEAAVEQSMELWRSGVSKSLRSVDQSFRDNIQRTGQTPYLLMEAKDKPEEQAIWKEGLGKLLTPEELVLTASLQVKRVEAEQKELTEILNPQTAKLREQLTGRMLKRVGDLELDLLDGVGSLVSKSLLVKRDGVGGEPRRRPRRLERPDSSGPGSSAGDSAGGRDDQVGPMDGTEEGSVRAGP